MTISELYTSWSKCYEGSMKRKHQIPLLSRTCTRCERSSPDVAFTHHYNRSTECHECQRLSHEEIVAADPVSYAKNRRNHHVIQTNAQKTRNRAFYDSALEKQHGLCAICSTEETAISRSAFRPAKLLSVDHDHVSGELRGLLCHRCNIGLGRFRDDPQILEKAALYLETSRV